MRKRKQAEVNGAGEPMPAEQRAALVQYMNTLAFRSPQLQQELSRIARVAGLGEVETHIRQLRAYAQRASK
jgi:hypothetical protein